MRLIDADIMADEWLDAENELVYCANDVLDSIDKQPTAYDVDAVIAELEKGLQNAKMHKEKHSYSDKFINGFIKGYETAIDVVKRGGRKWLKNIVFLKHMKH